MTSIQPAPVRDGRTMLARMTPVLRPETYVFCTTRDPDVLTRIGPACLALFQEGEGTTLVLKTEDAARAGFDATGSMARIVLEVFSALDGVGLTAAVATALADEGIPCNVIAAYHHDHVFVPVDAAERALHALQAVQAVQAMQARAAGTAGVPQPGR